MNRRQFIEKLAKSFWTKKITASNILDTFIKTIEDSLLSWQEVNFHGFGKFSISQRSRRKWYNPKTKEAMQINSYTTVVFKPWKPLKTKLRNKFN